MIEQRMLAKADSTGARPMAVLAPDVSPGVDTERLGPAHPVSMSAPFAMLRAVLLPQRPIKHGNHCNGTAVILTSTCGPLQTEPHPSCRETLGDIHNHRRKEVFFFFEEKI